MNVMLRKVVILLAFTVALMAIVLFNILTDPNKAYLLSQRVGFNTTGGYFHVHRHLSYEAAQWRALQRADKTIYMLGDSITAGMDASQVSADLFNLGVSGERIEWLSNDMEKVQAIGNPPCIMITLGVNDLAAGLSLETMKENYARLLANLPPATTVIAGEVLPVTKNFSDLVEGVRPARIAQFNQTVSKTCNALSNCELASWSSAFSEEAGDGLPQYYLSDGLHLNTEGYAVWRKLVGDALRTHQCL